MARPGTRPPMHLSDLEALLWTLDADPHLSSTFANVSFLDRAPDLGLLRRKLLAATRSVPLLGMRVHASTGPLPPRWEPVDEIDMEHHVRRVEVPAGTTDAAVLQMAADIAGEQFDRQRPLWQFTVIDGLTGGRSAMVQKLHHTITDGEGGIRMSMAFVDLTRDAPAPDLHGSDPLDAGDSAADGPTDRDGERNAVAALLDSIADIARRGLQTAGQVADEIGASMGAALRDPASIASAIAALPIESAATARSLLRQLAVVDGARSPLWTERSLDRTLITFSMPLQDVKDAGRRMGASVNDVFVAAAAGGAGRYHRERGTDPDEVRISMPVSTRTDGSVAGNAFTPTRVLVPLAEDPRLRLAEIHDRLTVAKAEKAIGIAGPLVALAALVPDPILIGIARQQVATVDFAASNVRAAPFDLFIAGSLMLSNHPIGPLGGTAWNITTMSYRGDLDVGVHIDTAAVDDPAALVEAIQASFDELIALT